MSAGKGDKPRSCFSKKFKDNFDQIQNWASKNSQEIRNYITKKGKKIYKYP
jgi:ribosomal protein S17E